MMAQTKSGSTTSTQSKGGAGVYAKHIQRKFNRAQEKVLQKFGKSDETRDEQFELHVENLQAQQSDGHRIYKDLKAYLNAVKVMRDASSRLFQSLFDAYELDWEGGEDLGAIVEGEDLLWNDYDSKLRDQLLTMESYMSQFPDIRERLAKRNRKLVDYDSSRHHFESLQNAKKRDDIKIVKAEEEMKTAKKIFEDMNLELKQELPVLYSSRIGCYATVFQAISDLRDILYKELAKNNQDLKNVMSNLRAQHPNKNFVIKNFSRSGSLKRRSLKDALSPRSLRSSFLEFHTSYSPRGSLRRENTSSFRYDRGIYESSNPELQSSHSRTKPTEVPGPEAEDADPSCTSKKSPTGEGAPSAVAARDDDEGPGRARSVAKEQSDMDDQGRETKERERLSASHQDEEMACLGPREDPSLEASDENALEPSENHSGKANPEASSTSDVSEDHTANPGQLTEPGPDGMENGITAGCKTDTEESGASCKRNTLNDMLDKVDEEINGQL